MMHTYTVSATQVDVILSAFALVEGTEQTVLLLTEITIPLPAIFPGKFSLIKYTIFMFLTIFSNTQRYVVYTCTIGSCMPLSPPLVA